MIIGVDAGAIGETDDRLKVGVYRVTLELLKHLSRIDSVNSYRLYSFAPIPQDTMRQFGPNMMNIPLIPSTGYLKLRVPIELSLHPVDMFLGLSQALPQGVGKSLGFIYDLGFIHYPKLYGTHAKKLEKQTEHVTHRSTHIVTISKATKVDIIKTYNISPSKITVLYPGISDIFRKNKEKIHHSIPYFLMVGLLKPGKNIPLAIRAFALLLTKTKKLYDLVIIGGDTGLDSDIYKTIKESKLENRVHLLGFVQDREVAKWYKGAKAFLALSSSEGYCLPAAEAIASGCPVIHVKNGALSEIVGDAGIEVKVNDQERIANAMISIQKRRFDVSCKKQSSQFQWTKFAQRVYDILDI